MRRVLLFLLVFALVAATACGTDSGDAGDAGSGKAACVEPFEQAYSGAEAYPVFASTELVVGENRFLVGVLNDDDAPIGSPDIDVHVEFFDLTKCPEEAAGEEDMEFFYTIPKSVGLYRTEATFDAAGTWGAEVTITGDGIEETLKGSFPVLEESSSVAIGEEPPASDTPTSDDVKDLSEISTDKRPNPRFYELSIADALKRGQPFVVAFTTPKFCQTQTCGPTLEVVKSVAKDFPKTTFVHVEPYELPADPAKLEPVKAVLDWGLRTEPWVFVVDEKGEVAAKFEGGLAPEELEGALEEVVGNG